MADFAGALKGAAGAPNAFLAALAVHAGQPSAAAPTDVGSLDAAAAQAAYAHEQATPQYLKFGPWTTPLRIPHWLDNTLSGMGGAAYDLYAQARKSMGVPVDPLVEDVAQNSMRGKAGQVGRFLTDTAVALPIGAAASALLPEAAGAVGLARLARVAATPLGRTLVGGAAQGFGMSPAGERGTGAVLGAAGGGLLHGVGALAGTAIRGIARTPEARLLLARGVRLTPGQMNPMGAPSRFEQAATAIPFVGARIAKARAAAPVQFARTMVEDAMPKGASPLPPADDFNEWIAHAKDAFKKAYDGVLGHGKESYPVGAKIMRTQGEDVPLGAALKGVAQTPRLGLTAQERAGLGTVAVAHLREALAAARRNGGMTAEDLQGLRTIFRETGRDTPPGDKNARAIRAFWNDAAGKVTEALQSQLPADAAKSLADVDSRYGGFAVVRDTARALKDRPEGPTAHNFSTAISKHTDPNAYAAGEGWNRDLAKAGAHSFRTTVPFTGMTGAGLVAPMMHGLEGAGAYAIGRKHPLAAMGLLALAGGLHGAYSPAGLRAFAGETGPQEWAARLLGQNAPALRSILPLARTGAIQGLLNAALPAR